MQPVAAAMGDELADQTPAGQREVAQHVEGFVPGALVGKPQAIVDRTIVVEHQEVSRSDSRAQALPHQGVGLGP